MDIFPVDIDTSQDTSISDRGSNLLYDFNEGDFIIRDGKFIEVSGDAGVVFWIEKTLKTEYEISAVYKNTEYGTKINEIKGMRLPLPIEENILTSNVKDSLLRHERINSVNVVSFSHDGAKVKIVLDITFNEVSEEEDIVYSGSEQGFTKLHTLEDIKDFINIDIVSSNRFTLRTE